MEATEGQTEAAIHDYEKAQSIVPMVEYAGALEDLYRAAGKTAKSQGQRDLIETIEKLGKATNEKTNRNLALVLADHSRDLGVALRLMETELPTRGDVYTWDALGWVLFKNGRLEEAKTASAKATRLGTPEPHFIITRKKSRKHRMISGSSFVRCQRVLELGASDGQFQRQSLHEITNHCARCRGGIRA